MAKDPFSQTPLWPQEERGGEGKAKTIRRSTSLRPIIIKNRPPPVAEVAGEAVEEERGIGAISKNDLH